MVSALEPETLLKILELQELLRKVFSVHKTFKAVSLGWRNYYKYAPIIYMDPKLLTPLPKGFIGDYNILGIDLDQLRIVPGGVAKYIALDIVSKQLPRGKIRRSELGRKWLELAQDLLKAWIHEISIQLIEQSHL